MVDKIKTKQTSWKEIRHEIEKNQNKMINPKYFAYFESYKGRSRNTKDRDYAIAFSDEAVKFFGEQGYYELHEKMFTSNVRSDELPIFYCSHEKDLAKKTLKRLFEVYKLFT